MAVIIVIGIIVFVVMFTKIGGGNSEIEKLQQEIKNLETKNKSLTQSADNLVNLIQKLMTPPISFMDELYEKCVQELQKNAYSFIDKEEEIMDLWKSLQAPRLPPSFADHVYRYKTKYHQMRAIQSITDWLSIHPEEKVHKVSFPIQRDEYVIQQFHILCDIYFNCYQHLLKLCQKNYDYYSNIDNKIARLTQQQQNIEKEKQELVEYEEKSNIRLGEKYGKLEQDKKTLLHAFKQNLNGAGEIYGNLYAEVDTDFLDRFAEYFKDKKHASFNSSRIVAHLKREQKAKIKDLRKYEYVINAYERMFPWLSEFKEYPMEAVLKANADDQEEEEIFTHYLSPEERETLTKTERFQRVLDRYEDSYDKTNWQIGLFYERYIGYTYDIKQWKVIMNGAKKRWQDMGIDIIASKDGKTELIQCKYWAANKTIYENYIFQLFGTTIDYIMEHFPTEDPWKILKQGIVTPVFVTSTQVSDTARRVAHILNIDLRENVKLDKKYPKIKCNPDSPDGKIFHLPFDQQYDNFQLGNNPNAFYAKTVAEAEKMGFRRAYRWHPTE